MDFPAVRQPCPITEMLNYIPQHSFYCALIYVDCAGDEEEDEEADLDWAQVLNLRRHSEGLWRHFRSFTLHHLRECVCTQYAWINSQRELVVMYNTDVYIDTTHHESVLHACPEHCTLSAQQHYLTSQ